MYLSNTFNVFDTFNTSNVLKTTKIDIETLAHSESQVPIFQGIYCSTFSTKLTMKTKEQQQKNKINVGIVGKTNIF